MPLHDLDDQQKRTINVIAQMQEMIDKELDNTSSKDKVIIEALKALKSRFYSLQCEIVNAATPHIDVPKLVRQFVQVNMPEKNMPAAGAPYNHSFSHKIKMMLEKHRFVNKRARYQENKQENIERYLISFQTAGVIKNMLLPVNSTAKASVSSVRSAEEIAEHADVSPRQTKK